MSIGLCQTFYKQNNFTLLEYWEYKTDKWNTWPFFHQKLQQASCSHPPLTLPASPLPLQLPSYLMMISKAGLKAFLLCSSRFATYDLSFYFIHSDLFLDCPSLFRRTSILKTFFLRARSKNRATMFERACCRDFSIDVFVLSRRFLRYSRGVLKNANRPNDFVSSPSPPSTGEELPVLESEDLQGQRQGQSFFFFESTLSDFQSRQRRPQN